jgi:cytochrome c peroxidase
MNLRRTAVLFSALAYTWGCGSHGSSSSDVRCSGYPDAKAPLSLHAVAPDLTFDGLDESGAPTAIALHDYFEPCANRSRLLVVRVSAAWCGTCRWHASHTGELQRLDIGPRLELLDLLVADDDNYPAGAPALASWRARIDAPERLAVDPDNRFGAVHGSTHAPLPLIVAIDSRTMNVVRVLDDPDPDTLAFELRSALAELDGSPAPLREAAALVDGRFTRDAWDLLAGMTLPGAPPPDPSNAKADDPAAAALGKKLFADTGLSPSHKVACASCHDATKDFADGVPRSTGGVSPVTRNAPSITLASHSPWQFWDGRADSLWAQALGPPEAAAELDSSRLFVDHVVWTAYKAEYEAVWGALPDLSDVARFPANGRPGAPEWAAMTPEDQSAATRVYVNVGKSIAAFERTMRVQPGALDRYVGGDLAALAPAEKDGLAAFFRAGCAQCHFGPRLTDDAFHVLGLPTGRADGLPDRGRIDGLANLFDAEFGAASAWSDAPKGGASKPPVGSMLGAFKTPTLRGAPETAPYGHAGTSPTLEDVLAKHGFVQAQSAEIVGAVEPWIVTPDASTQAAIVPFLRVLSAPPIVP